MCTAYEFEVKGQSLEWRAQGSHRSGTSRRLCKTRSARCSAPPRRWCPFRARSPPTVGWFRV